MSRYDLAIRNGLERNPTHARLLALQQKLGVRDEPPLAFLPRGHALNVLLGRLRHGWRVRAVARYEQRMEEAALDESHA